MHIPIFHPNAVFHREAPATNAACIPSPTLTAIEKNGLLVPTIRQVRKMVTLQHATLHTSPCQCQGCVCMIQTRGKGQRGAPSPTEMAPTLPRTPGKWWWTKWTASSTGKHMDCSAQPGVYLIRCPRKSLGVTGISQYISMESGNMSKPRSNFSLWPSNKAVRTSKYNTPSTVGSSSSW